MKGAKSYTRPVHRPRKADALGGCRVLLGRGLRCRRVETHVVGELLSVTLIDVSRERQQPCLSQVMNTPSREALSGKRQKIGFVERERGRYLVATAPLTHCPLFAAATVARQSVLGCGQCSPPPQPRIIDLDNLTLNNPDKRKIVRKGDSTSHTSLLTKIQPSSNCITPGPKKTTGF